MQAWRLKTAQLLALTMATVAITVGIDASQNAAHADTTFNEVAFWSSDGTKLGVAKGQPYQSGPCTVQKFGGGSYGDFFRVSSGKGKPIYTVRSGMYQGYLKYGGPSGSLGCPAGNEYSFAGGQRQDFTGGVLLWRKDLAATKVSTSAAKAIGWAWGKIGQKKTSLTTSGLWSGWCEAFVKNAYSGTKSYPTAKAHYNALKAKGLIQTSKNPPPGAIVFWNVTEWGHTGISVGAGQVISTAGGPGDAKAVHKHGIDNYSGYLGWSLTTGY